MFTSNHFLFRSLDAAEVEDFRQGARDNYDSMAADLEEKPHLWQMWHPVSVAEFFRIREERGA